MRDWLPQGSTSIAKEVNNMKMKDLVDLVRAGLKPAEIKEMIELEKQVADIDIEEPEEIEQPKDEPEQKQEPEVEKKVDPTLDELKQAKEDLANLKSQLVALQNEYKNKDISQSQEKSLDKQIEDIFSNLF